MQMMDENNQVIEVSILPNDDVKAKVIFGTDHALNSTKPSVSDDKLNTNYQLYDDTDNNQQIPTTNFIKQIKSFCFPGNSKVGKRQRRTSVNSTEDLIDDTRFLQCGCNIAMVENVLLLIAFIVIVVIFLVPVVLYYTRPPTVEIDGSMANLFKTCQFPVSLVNKTSCT